MKIKKELCIEWHNSLTISGERGIRTPGTFDSTSDFESGALNQLCHLSFTRRSAQPEGQARRRVYHYPTNLRSSQRGLIFISIPQQVYTTNVFLQTPFPTRFSNTAQIQRPYPDPEKNSTMPIEQAACPLLWAPILFDGD